MDIEKRKEHMENASKISEKIAREQFRGSLRWIETEKELGEKEEKIVEKLSKPHDAGHPVSELDEK